MLPALTAAYQGEMKRTRQAVADHVASVWRRLPDYRDEQVPGFLQAALPVVQAGQRRAVALTSAYLSRALGAPPVGLDVETLVGAAVRNGMDPAEVYRRPFVTTWAAIAKIGVQAAIEKGLSRLTSTADMDVAMSGRDTLLAYQRVAPAVESDRIIGWRRVAEPGCCDFCLSIDGAHTGPDEPQPLHNRCGCTADPITAGSSLVGALLGVGSRIDKTVIREHGELGPVITAHGDSFAGPDDLDDPDYIES